MPGDAVFLVWYCKIDIGREPGQLRSGSFYARYLLRKGCAGKGTEREAMVWKGSPSRFTIVW